jgi:glycolate oxidase FAD binding subunit
LFVGSMGTLGVVSEVTVKLRPLAKAENLVLLSFPEESLEDIRAFSAVLLDSMMEPVSLELLNCSLSEKLTGESAYTLAISFEDVENAVKYQQDFVESKQPLGTKITILDREESGSFWEQFYKIGPNGAARNQFQSEASLKVGVVNVNVPCVIMESQALQNSHNVLVEAHGGIGHGLCSVNIKGEDHDIVSAIEHVRNTVTELGGYVIVKHLPFHLREQVNVWGEKPSYFFLLEGIKAKIDPNRVLNHKRFVGGI